MEIMLSRALVGATSASEYTRAERRVVRARADDIFLLHIEQVFDGRGFISPRENGRKLGYDPSFIPHSLSRFIPGIFESAFSKTPFFYRAFYSRQSALIVSLV